MKHRIFLAIKISDELRAQLRSFKNRFSNMSIRWSLFENLHITIVPPWYSDNPEQEIRILRSVHTYPEEFFLQFTEIRFGPDQRRPRLLWVLGRESPGLTQLKTVLEKSLQQKTKYKNFIPHITLGRFKSRLEPEIRSSFPYTVDWAEHVSTLTLLESFLSPKGARYETVAEFPLQKKRNEAYT